MRFSNRFNFAPLRSFCTSTPKRSFYQILQLTPQASQSEIKQNYYTLAKEYHPDKNPLFSDKFKLINEAYSTLKDPTKKQKYDQQQMRFSSSDRFGGKQRTSSYTGESQNYPYGYRKPSSSSFYDKPRSYQNPYSSAENYNANMNFSMNSRQEQYDQFMREMGQKSQRMRGMEKGRMKSPNDLNEQIRKVMVAGFGFACVVIVVELILKIYQFNAVSARRSYYERLDPRQMI